MCGPEVIVNLRYIYFDHAGLCGVGENNPFGVAASHEQWETPRPTPSQQLHVQQLQQQQQPQHQLLTRGNFNGKQAVATAEQQLASNSPSQEASRTGRAAGGEGSQQKADWQAKERLLRCHNLVVGIPQGQDHLCTEALALMRGKLCGRGKMSGRKA